MVPATDFERILLGRLTGETAMLEDSEAPAPDSPAAAFSGVGGNAGFLMR